jgi:methionine synthase II (cobalamin-independent)
VFPGLDVDAGVAIPDRALGYADAALESYHEFVRLRDEGVIPAGVRFQVSVPTPFAVVVAWAANESQARLFEPFKQALFREVETIQAEIPAQDLAIQWDVAVEIGALEQVFKAIPELASFERIVGELVDCIRAVQPPVERGLHFCYGDYKHRHFVPPTDLGLVVRVANAVAAEAPYDFVHMPVDHDNGVNASYFAPLSNLSVGAAELALGVIDYENDTARIDELVAAAESAGRPFAVATECGMARLGERGESVNLEDLLRQHARVAEPVR